MRKKIEMKMKKMTQLNGLILLSLLLSSCSPGAINPGSIKAASVSRLGGTADPISVAPLSLNLSLILTGGPFILTKNMAITPVSFSHVGGTLTSCTSASLPAGLTVVLASGECEISGTPTSISSASNYSVSATNESTSSTQSVNLTVNDLAPSVLAFAGSPFSFTQNAAITAASSTHSGGAILTCAGASLPSGLSMSVVSGECQLSGTPTSTSAASNSTITASNATGSTTASINITVTAAAATPTPTATPAATPMARFAFSSSTTGSNIYSFDLRSGTMVANGPIKTSSMIFNIISEPTNGFLYVVNSFLEAYSVNATTGLLSATPVSANKMYYGGELTFNSAGTYAYSAADSTLRFGKVDAPTGAITWSVLTQTIYPDPWSVTIAPDNKTIYVTDRLVAKIKIFSVNTTDGSLAPGVIPEVTFTNPADVFFIDRQNKYAYVMEGSLYAVYTIDANGSLINRLSLSNKITSIHPYIPVAYGSSNGTTVSTYPVNITTGVISASTQTLTVGTAINFSYNDPAGLSIYFQDATAPNIYGFSINAVNGLLTPHAPVSVSSDPTMRPSFQFMK